MDDNYISELASSWCPKLNERWRSYMKEQHKYGMSVGALIGAVIWGQYQAGYSTDYICENMSVSKSQVRRWIKKNRDALKARVAMAPIESFWASLGDEMRGKTAWIAGMISDAA